MLPRFLHSIGFRENRALRFAGESGDFLKVALSGELVKSGLSEDAKKKLSEQAEGPDAQKKRLDELAATTGNTLSKHAEMLGKLPGEAGDSMWKSTLNFITTTIGNFDKNNIKGLKLDEFKAFQDNAVKKIDAQLTAVSDKKKQADKKAETAEEKKKKHEDEKAAQRKEKKATYEGVKAEIEAQKLKLPDTLPVLGFAPEAIDTKSPEKVAEFMKNVPEAIKKYQENTQVITTLQGQLSQRAGLLGRLQKKAQESLKHIDEDLNAVISTAVTAGGFILGPLGAVGANLIYGGVMAARAEFLRGEKKQKAAALNAEINQQKKAFQETAVKLATLEKQMDGQNQQMNGAIDPVQAGVSDQLGKHQARLDELKNNEEALQKKRQEEALKVTAANGEKKTVAGQIKAFESMPDKDSPANREAFKALVKRLTELETEERSSQAAADAAQNGIIDIQKERTPLNTLFVQGQTQRDEMQVIDGQVSEMVLTNETELAQGSADVKAGAKTVAELPPVEVPSSISAITLGIQGIGRAAEAIFVEGIADHLDEASAWIRKNAPILTPVAFSLDVVSGVSEGVGGLVSGVAMIATDPVGVAKGLSMLFDFESEAGEQAREAFVKALYGGEYFERGESGKALGAIIVNVVTTATGGGAALSGAKGASLAYSVARAAKSGRAVAAVKAVATGIEVGGSELIRNVIKLPGEVLSKSGKALKFPSTFYRNRATGKATLLKQEIKALRGQLDVVDRDIADLAKKMDAINPKIRQLTDEQIVALANDPKQLAELGINNPFDIDTFLNYKNLREKRIGLNKSMEKLKQDEALLGAEEVEYKEGVEPPVKEPPAGTTVVDYEPGVTPDPAVLPENQAVAAETVAEGGSTVATPKKQPTQAKRGKFGEGAKTAKERLGDFGNGKPKAQSTKERLGDFGSGAAAEADDFKLVNFKVETGDFAQGTRPAIGAKGTLTFNGQPRKVRFAAEQDGKLVFEELADGKPTGKKFTTEPPANNTGEWSLDAVGNQRSPVEVKLGELDLGELPSGMIPTSGGSNIEGYALAVNGNEVQFLVHGPNGWIVVKRTYADPAKAQKLAGKLDGKNPGEATKLGKNGPDDVVLACDADGNYKVERRKPGKKEPSKASPEPVEVTGTELAASASALELPDMLGALDLSELPTASVRVGSESFSGHIIGLSNVDFVGGVTSGETVFSVLIVQDGVPRIVLRKSSDGFSIPMSSESIKKLLDAKVPDRVSLGKGPDGEIFAVRKNGKFYIEGETVEEAAAAAKPSGKNQPRKTSGSKKERMPKNVVEEPAPSPGKYEDVVAGTPEPTLLGSPLAYGKKRLNQFANFVGRQFSREKAPSATLPKFEFNPKGKKVKDVKAEFQAAKEEYLLQEVGPGDALRNYGRDIDTIEKALYGKVKDLEKSVKELEDLFAVDGNPATKKALDLERSRLANFKRAQQEVYNMRKMEYEIYAPAKPKAIQDPKAYLELEATVDVSPETLAEVQAYIVKKAYGHSGEPLGSRYKTNDLSVIRKELKDRRDWLLSRYKGSEEVRTALIKEVDDTLNEIKQAKALEGMLEAKKKLAEPPKPKPKPPEPDPVKVLEDLKQALRADPNYVALVEEYEKLSAEVLGVRPYDARYTVEQYGKTPRELRKALERQIADYDEFIANNPGTANADKYAKRNDQFRKLLPKIDQMLELEDRMKKATPKPKKAVDPDKTEVITEPKPADPSKTEALEPTTPKDPEPVKVESPKPGPGPAPAAQVRRAVPFDYDPVPGATIVERLNPSGQFKTAAEAVDEWVGIGTPLPDIRNQLNVRLQKLRMAFGTGDEVIGPNEKAAIQACEDALAEVDRRLGKSPSSKPPEPPKAEPLKPGPKPAPEAQVRRVVPAGYNDTGLNRTVPELLNDSGQFRTAAEAIDEWASVGGQLPRMREALSQRIDELRADIARNATPQNKVQLQLCEDALTEVDRRLGKSPSPKPPESPKVEGPKPSPEPAPTTKPATAEADELLPAFDRSDGKKPTAEKPLTDLPGGKTEIPRPTPDQCLALIREMEASGDSLNIIRGKLQADVTSLEMLVPTVENLTELALKRETIEVINTIIGKPGKPKKVPSASPKPTANTPAKKKSSKAESNVIKPEGEPDLALGASPKESAALVKPKPGSKPAPKKVKRVADDAKLEAPTEKRGLLGRITDRLTGRKEKEKRARFEEIDQKYDDLLDEHFASLSAAEKEELYLQAGVRGIPEKVDPKFGKWPPKNVEQAKKWVKILKGDSSDFADAVRQSQLRRAELYGDAADAADLIKNGGKKYPGVNDAKLTELRTLRQQANSGSVSPKAYEAAVRQLANGDPVLEKALLILTDGGESQNLANAARRVRANNKDFYDSGLIDEVDYIFEAPPVSTKVFTVESAPKLTKNVADALDNARAIGKLGPDAKLAPELEQVLVNSMGQKRPIRIMGHFEPRELAEGRPGYNVIDNQGNHLGAGIGAEGYSGDLARPLEVIRAGQPDIMETILVKNNKNGTSSLYYEVGGLNSADSVDRLGGRIAVVVDLPAEEAAAVMRILQKNPEQARVFFFALMHDVPRGTSILKDPKRLPKFEKVTKGEVYFAKVSENDGFSLSAQQQNGKKWEKLPLNLRMKDAYNKKGNLEYAGQIYKTDK